MSISGGWRGDGGNGGHRGCPTLYKKL